MFDEMRFLFSVNPSLRNRLGTNRTVNTENPIESVNFLKEINEDDDTKIDINTYVINREGVRNYIQSDVNKAYRNEKNNPYLDLIRFTNEPETAKALRLWSTDFAYLRDIGVMPLNRLMILRRFPEGTIVPVDLNELEVEPISVVIGWIKADSNLLDFSFSEKWVTQSTMLHEMLSKIINDEFGFDISNIIPIPGWGVGFMFQVLHEMGLTSYNSQRLPLGDPNLLREALTRPHEEFGLESSFNFNFETFYEQKYIAGIDPTVSTFDIINNLLTMGTSDTRFMGKKGSDVLEKLRNANESYNDANAWAEFAVEVLNGFVEALGTALEFVKGDLAEIGDLFGLGEIGLEEEEKPTPGEEIEEEQQSRRTRLANWVTGKGRRDRKREEQEKLEESEDLSTSTLLGSIRVFESLFETNIAKSIIASTFGRYQWPLRGSISMLTGDPTTPWHLTIGNPYAPLLSMNNIHVTKVDIKGGNEMGHNDLPKIMQVTISMKEGRNLGKQEIFEMFGVRYKRRYNKLENNDI